MLAFDFQTVLAVIIAAVFGPWFAWFAIKALRTGTTGPKKLPTTRAANPVLFWIYVTMYVAVAAMMVALAVFKVDYRPGAIRGCEWAAMAVFAFCFDVAFLLMAAVTGFHTVRGFRTGTATFVWQGSVEFYNRGERPGWYWSTQIQNLAATAFLGTIGLGTIGITLFFALGPLLLG